MSLGVGKLCNGNYIRQGRTANKMKMTIIPSVNVSRVNITAGARTISLSQSSIIDDISVGENVTLQAVLPETSTGDTIYYHNGSTPSNGNYKYKQRISYSFDQWKNPQTNEILTTEAIYSFTAAEDIALSCIAYSSITETNIEYAISAYIVNADTSNIVDVTIDGSTFTSSGTIYRWPSQGDITISATPKSKTTSGPFYTDDNQTPRPGAYRWYIDRTYSLKDVSGSDGTSSTIVNPTTNVTYSVKGTYSDTTVSKSIASSSTSSSLKSTLSYATNTLTRSTKNTSSYSTYYYWLTNSKSLYSSSTVSGYTSAKANSIGLSLSTSGGWNYNSNTTYSITYTVYTRFSKTSGSATKSSTTYSYRDDNYSGTKSSTYNYYFYDNLGFTSCTQNFAYQRCTNIYTYVGTRYFSDRTVFENNRNYAPLLETTLKVKVNAMSNLYSSKITTTYKGYSSSGNYETHVSSYTTRSYYKSTSYYW